MSTPISLVLTPSACLTAGIRAAQLANANPHRPKIAKSALRHASTWERERSEVIMAG